MERTEELERLQEARDEALSEMDEAPLTHSLLVKYEATEAALREFLSRPSD